MNREEFSFWLRTSFHIAAILAFSALAVNQYSQLVSASEQVRQFNLQQEASVDCLTYRALALVVDGNVYCYNVYQGQMFIAELSVLQEKFPLGENGQPTRP